MQLKDKPYPSIEQSFGLALLLVVSSMAAPLIDGLFGINHEKTPFIIAILAEMLSYCICFTIVIVYALNKTGDPRGNNLKFTTVPKGILLFVALITPFVGMLIQPLADITPVPKGMKEWLDEAFVNMFQPHILSFISIAILPSIFEEILFRGIILEGMLSRYRPASAIFWSAFLFGLIHLNPQQFVVAFFLGLLMGWLYWKTRSLIPGMVVHLVNNGLSYILVISFGEADSLAELMGKPVYFLIIAVSLAIVPMGIYRLSRLLQPEASYVPLTNDAV